MIEAYAIGVTLSLQGNIGAEMSKVGQQFELLNKIIGRSQMAVNELAAGMRGLSRVGRAAADSWTAAANAMERAARAAKSAGAAMPNGAGGGTARGAAAASAAAQLMLAAPRTGFTLPGPPLPTGGGSSQRMGAPGGMGMMPYVPNGSFAGGPGTGTTGLPMVLPPGGAPPGGGIPLNLGPMGSSPGGAGRPMPTHGEFAIAAAGFGALGYALTHFVEDAVKARAEVEHLQAQMRLMGMSGTQVSEALATATGLQRSVPGMTIGGGLHIIKDLLAVTQNAQESLDPTLLRSFSQAAVVLQSAGKSDAIGELFKAMQAAELRGAFSGADGKPDTAKAAAFLQNVLSTTTQTGGRVGPSEILQVLKSSGLGGAMMDDKTLFADMIAPVISMGAARAGTGIQAFAAQFSAGKMSDAAVKLMLRMGLIENLPAAAGTTPDEQAAYLKPLYKTGLGQYALPQNMMPYRNNPELNPSQHPIEFMDKVLLPQIDAYNLAHNGAPRDAADLMAQRMAQSLALASRIPEGNVIGDVLRNMPLILRDREAIAGANTRNANDGAFNQLQATDPKVKMQAFSAALNGLMVALGGPIMDSAIKAMQSLTTALNAIGTFATAHPDLTKDLMLAAVGVAAFSLAMAALSGVFLVAGPMLAVLRFLPTGLNALGVSLGVIAAAAPGTIAGGLAGVGRGLLALIGPIAALIALAASAGELNKQAAAAGQRTHDFIFGPGTGFLGLNGPRTGVNGTNDQMRSFLMQNGIVPQSPGVQRQSFTPPAAANDMRPTQINLRVNLDGREVARNTTMHQGRDLSGPARGTTGFDARESPMFPGPAAVAI